MSIYLRDRNFKKTEFKSEQKIYNYLSDKINYLKYYKVSINNGLNWIDGDKYFNSLTPKYLSSSLTKEKNDSYIKSKESSGDKENEKKGFSAFSIYLFLMTVVLISVYFYLQNKKSENFNTRNTINNTNSHSSGSSTGGNINSLDTGSSHSSSNESYGNSNNSPSSNNNEDNLTYKCLACDGSGQSVCGLCKGKGLRSCTNCNGLGYINERDGNSHGCNNCLNSGNMECKKYTTCPIYPIGCGGSRTVDKDKHEIQVGLLNIDKSIENGLNNN